MMYFTSRRTGLAPQGFMGREAFFVDFDQIVPQPVGSPEFIDSFGGERLDGNRAVFHHEFSGFSRLHSSLIDKKHGRGERI